jgi:hypothetical protein
MLTGSKQLLRSTTGAGTNSACGRYCDPKDVTRQFALLNAAEARPM